MNHLLCVHVHVCAIELSSWNFPLRSHSSSIIFSHKIKNDNQMYNDEKERLQTMNSIWKWILLFIVVSITIMHFVAYQSVSFNLYNKKTKHHKNNTKFYRRMKLTTNLTILLFELKTNRNEGEIGSIGSFSFLKLNKKKESERKIEIYKSIHYFLIKFHFFVVCRIHIHIHIYIYIFL